MASTKKQNETVVACCVCASEFDPELVASVSCLSGHACCDECTEVFVGSVMANLQASFPPTCSICRGALVPNLFEAQLTQKQLDDFNSVVAMRALLPGEQIVNCLIENAASVDEDEAEEAAEELESHLTQCSSLAQDKKAVVKALEDGQKMPCPECGLAGRKDDSCLHMSCPSCQTAWCYFCGLAVADCDQDEGARVRSGRDHDIYAHNANWEELESRCPMYLTQIVDVDERWPSDDEECMDFLHRLRTLSLLRTARVEVGEQVFSELFTRFKDVRNCGFSELEVSNTDVRLLVREGSEDEEM
ncbi:hypothetical protein T484DRAFT_1820924 [Baffinella frigidus]|nr:hypothetical protein T484DRAFT_1820924 [Cryptophyta sp. CCMP2293]